MHYTTSNEYIILSTKKHLFYNRFLIMLRILLASQRRVPLDRDSSQEDFGQKSFENISRWALCYNRPVKQLTFLLKDYLEWRIFNDANT